MYNYFLDSFLYLSTILRFFKNKPRDLSFSQLGEDLIIDNHLIWLGLDPAKPGAYIDLGCYHPWNGSNTYRFYRRGSRGYAIDIGQSKNQLWRHFRRRDLFINSAIVPNDYKYGTVRFSRSSSRSETDHVIGYGVIHDSHTEVIEVPALRVIELEKLVKKSDWWFRSNWRLLSIDVEGLDFDVLRSFNLSELNIDIVAVEHFIPSYVHDHEKVVWLALKSELTQFMVHNNFSLQSICGPTLIFVKLKKLDE